jgi:hypothetical protein
VTRLYSWRFVIPSVAATATVACLMGCGGTGRREAAHSAGHRKLAAATVQTASVLPGVRPPAGQVIHPVCPTAQEATVVVGQSMQQVGGVVTVGGQRQMACGYLPSGVPASAGTASVAVSFLDMPWSAAHVRQQAERRCKGVPSDVVCHSAVTNTPQLGSRTFRFYVGVEGRGVTEATCSVMVRDIGGTPLEVTAKAQRGGEPKYNYRGSISEATICAWAEALVVKTL